MHIQLGHIIKVLLQVLCHLGKASGWFELPRLVIAFLKVRVLNSLMVLSLLTNWASDVCHTHTSLMYIILCTGKYMVPYHVCEGIIHRHYFGAEIGISKRHNLCYG